MRSSPHPFQDIDPSLSNQGTYWAKLLQRCRSEQLERTIQVWRPEIEMLAKTLKVPTKFLDQQIRLHLPALQSLKKIEGLSSIPPSIEQIVELRAQKFRNLVGYATRHSGNPAAEKGRLRIDRNKQLTVAPHGITAHFSAVTQSFSEIIEGSLHYMQSYRPDTVAQFGIFLNNASFPVCYASFSNCDRMYIQKSLGFFLQDMIDSNQIIILARAFGLPGNPENSISSLVSHSAHYFLSKGYRYMVTALNPFLHFDGSSLSASGFKPFSLAPVAYSYNDTGEYKTRRQGGETLASSVETPPNILLVRGLDRKTRRKISSASQLIELDACEHEIFPKPNISVRDIKRTLQDAVIHMRPLLENVWGPETRYPKITFNKSDPISKGQCGVTSAYLGRHLLKSGWKVLFCEGDVEFLDGTPPIYQHCWLRIPQGDNADMVNDIDLIIDLTADQTGFSQPTIICRYSELDKIGVSYKEKSAQSPNEIGVDHLRSRLETLETELHRPH